MRGTPSAACRPTRRTGIIPAHAGNTLAICRFSPCSRDHPRACGEHPAGSYAGVYRSRIIPAHAGNTSTWPARGISTEDHPRACGEHSAGLALWLISMGSSPRMRGTPGLVLLLENVDGIIPAHAGNTCSSRLCSTVAWDHPRACGEHMPDLLLLSVPLGSSPRMRGTLQRLPDRHIRRRIIPAHAGNTSV